MLEKPDVSDSLVIDCLQEAYGLQVDRLAFLPLGADVNTAVFKAIAAGGTEYFLKLRKGGFDEITVAVPQFLKSQGLSAIIAPLETRGGKNWTSLEPFRLVLYPFVEGKDGYAVALSDRQWLEFGAALKNIHAAQLPPALARLIPRETYSPYWYEQVKAFQAQAEALETDDPVSAQLIEVMRARRGEIDHLVARTEALGLALQTKAPDLVLCHSDIHAGNLHIGSDNALYIVDWDNPLFAPKEKDLALIGGCFQWRDKRQESLFYQGYGPGEVDRVALAYFRSERVIQDIAAFCQQLLGTTGGGKDRAQALIYFESNFLPGHEIELAFETQ